MKFTHIRMAALGSIAAGALMVGTVGIASAAPTNNFSITTLTTDNDYAVDGATDDNGPIAITSSHVLWNSESGVEAYAIADLSGATVTDVSEDDAETMFTNIKTATAHYLIATQGETTATIVGIGSINDNGTGSSAAVINLSEEIVINSAGDGDSIAECNLLGSGYGHVVIWDYCVGTMWNIDLPSGTVTVTEGVNTANDLQGVVTNDYYEGTDWFNQNGVVEHVDGEYWMVVGRADNAEDNNPVAIARFAITDPAGTVEDILPLTGAPDFWEFAVNVEAELWCTHIEGGSVDFASTENISNEPTICADATFSVADYLPSTGANSMFLVVTGLLMMAGGALALVRRPRIA